VPNLDGPIFLNITVGVEVIINVEVIDPDEDDPFTFNNTLPESSTFVDETGLFTWTPQFDEFDEITQGLMYAIIH